MPKFIEVTNLWDSHECETCGTSYAEGYTIWFDGKIVSTLQPHAHCFDGDSYTEADLLREVVRLLGHELVWEGA